MRHISCFLILTGVLAMAQGSESTSQQRTTGIIGIVSGQTARLTAVYPAAPAPNPQVVCSTTLAIYNTRGALVKSSISTAILAGTSVSIDVDASSILAGAARVEIYGSSVGAPCGAPVVNLQIIDDATQKTLVVVPAEVTYAPPPPGFTTPAFAR